MLEFIFGAAIGAATGFYFAKLWKKFNDWLDEGGPGPLSPA